MLGSVFIIVGSNAVNRVCLFALCLMSLLGFSEGSAALEVENAIASNLVGGRGCFYWDYTPCNVTPRTGCPASHAFYPTRYQSTVTPFYGKDSGQRRITCGCVKRPGSGCDSKRAFAKVYSCGSGSGTGSGDPGGSTTDP